MKTPVRKVPAATLARGMWARTAPDQRLRLIERVSTSSEGVRIEYRRGHVATVDPSFEMEVRDG